MQGLSFYGNIYLENSSLLTEGQIYEYKKGKFKKVRNTQYDPTVRMVYPPPECLGHISLNCIRCKHFAYSDVEYSLYKDFQKLVKKQK